MHSLSAYGSRERHWIGIADGVPRRIEKLGSWNGNKAFEIITLSDLVKQENFPPESFLYQPGKKMKLVDLMVREKEQEKRDNEALTLARQKLFSSELGVPFEDVRILKIGGGGLLGGMTWMSFESDRDISVSKPEKYSAADEQTRSQVFTMLEEVELADAALFSDPSKVEVLVSEERKEDNLERRTFVKVKGRKIYFYVFEWAG